MMQHMRSQQLHHPPHHEVGNWTFREFYKTNPPEFTESHDPMIAQVWLKGMEIIFRVTTCTDEENVIFATHLLPRAVGRLSNVAATFMTSRNILKDWEHFQAIFLDKYFPDSLRTQKDIDLQQLIQGNVLMDEFDEKFK